MNSVAVPYPGGDQADLVQQQLRPAALTEMFGTTLLVAGRELPQATFLVISVLLGVSSRRISVGSGTKSAAAIPDPLGR